MRLPAVAGALLLLPLAQPVTYDVIVRGGRVLDGTGNPWYRADVGIQGGRIAAVSRLEGAPARVVLDATDLYVAPGFIDVHSHAAEGLDEPQLRQARPLLAQGLTTVVLNPDGGGPWPLSEQRATYEKQGIGVNAALLVGHGTVREMVLGMADRAPTASELEKMKSLVRDGVAAGAFGLSSGLYYAPGSYAATGEVVALAREVAPSGVYTSHIRDEGDYTVGLVGAVDEVIAIAEGAGVAGVVTHFKALGPENWGKSVPACIHIERARERGVQVWVDQYPYDASGTSIVGALVPRWAEAGGRLELARRLRDPIDRKRLRDDMLANLKRRGGASKLVISRFVEDPSLEGRSLEDVAGERKVEPVDLALALLESGSAGLISFNMSELDIENIMKKDYTMTSTDGGLVPLGSGKPHPRAYGAFSRKIERYVVDREVIGLAHAIRSMTSLPATVFGFSDRGVIREGAWADVVVFDLARVRERATYAEPHQFSEGVVYSLVNGKVAVRGGEFTGALAGQVLHPRR